MFQKNLRGSEKMSLADFFRLFCLPTITKAEAIIVNTVIKCVIGIVGIFKDEVVTDCSNHEGRVAQKNLHATLGAGDERFFDAVTVQVANSCAKEGVQVTQIDVVVNADPGGCIICVIPGLIDYVQGLADDAFQVLIEKIAVSNIKA